MAHVKKWKPSGKGKNRMIPIEMLPYLTLQHPVSLSLDVLVACIASIALLQKL